MRLALLLLLCSCALYGQDRLSVNASEVLHDVRQLPLGLNLNTLTDDQNNRPRKAEELADGIAAGGFRSLRFPGGEKSDVYGWAAAPYDDPSTSYLLRQGPEDWPSNDPRFWDSDAGTWANDNYDFDEFIADCRATGSEPIVVVAFDGMYLPAKAGGTALSPELALELATEWVRYANVTMGYNVKYWSLGNETWQNEIYAGANPGFTTYGRDVATFARAMKEIDPTIQIGINGRTTDDFRRALAECAEVVDWLDVHTYPAWGWTTYDDYLNNQIDPGYIVDRAQDAIDELDDPAVREKLFIMMTEVSAYAFRQQNPWDTGHNVGQALANFDIMAQMLEDDRVAQTLIWNSRWIEEDAAGHLPTDILTGDNELNASGQSLGILANEVLEEMVATNSSSRVRAFATRTSDNDRLTVFLLNKDTEARNVELTLNDFLPQSQPTLAVLAGASPAATELTYEELGTRTANFNVVTLDLPPTSVSVLRFTASASPSSALPVDLLGFRGTVTPFGHQLTWDVTAEADLAGYHLESSRLGRHWSRVTFLPAAGDGTYQYVDPASGYEYYRLRIEELDGSSRLSEVIRLERVAAETGIYPNPTRGRFTVPESSRGAGYQILSKAGRLVRAGRVPSNGRLSLTNEADGVYYLVLEGGERYRLVKY